MKFAACVIVAAVAMTIVSPLAAAPGDVKNSFAAPCRYPTGLASDGNHLYVADWRTAKINEIDPANGTVTRSWDAPTPRPRGLTYAQGHLYVCDDHTGKIYALNLKTNLVERSFAAPGGDAATGLAYADGTLYVLEADSDLIYKVTPDDGTILGYFPVPDKDCACMTHDGRHLWISNRVTDEIYPLDPDSGMVLGVLDSPGPHPTGLAWLNGHLWNADFQTDRIYQLVVKDERMCRVFDPREARVEYLWAFTNYGPGEIVDLSVVLAVPHDLHNQRLLSEVVFSVPPAKTVNDRWGEPCALFEFETVPPGDKRIVSYTVDAEVSAVRWLIFPEDTGTLRDIPAEIREQYTADGTRYRTKSQYIQRTVQQIVGDEQNPYWIARKIYNHLLEKIEYEYIGGWDVPEVVLRRGTGSCSEYAFCMVALCRAAGLPARYQGSTVWRKDDASIDEPAHRWAEVYLPHHGWIPVDPSRGDKKSPVDQVRSFGQLQNHFLITTQSGGDSEYLRWSYNHHANYKSRGYCNVVEENIGFWEPLRPNQPKQ